MRMQSNSRTVSEVIIIRFYWVQSDLTPLIIIGLALIILLRLDFDFIVSLRLVWILSLIHI